MLFLAVWYWIYFYPVTLQQGLWFAGDLVRTYYPLGVELSRTLQSGRLPLWTPGMYGGFPVLADAQIGALYPFNLFFYALFPAHIALPYDVLFHMSWAAVGTFLWIRSLGLGTSSALFAGLIFSFSGFVLSRLPHASVLLTSAWLPWLLFFQIRFQNAWARQKKSAGVFFFLLAIGIGIQFLCGFPQIAFINTLAVIVVGLLEGWLASGLPIRQWRDVIRHIIQNGLAIAIPIILGAGIVAPQLATTAELVGYSVRGSALSYEFITNFSLPLNYLPQFVYPLIDIEPSEGKNNEYWAYLGIIPFALAVIAPFARRNARTIAFAVLTLVALTLALGQYTPVYSLIYALPGFNLFRVPARYLLLVTAGSTLLGATGLDYLTERLSATSADAKKQVALTIAFALAIAVSLWSTRLWTVDEWVSAWKVLPFVFAGLGACIFALVWKRRVSRSIFQVLILGSSLLDLSLIAPLFVVTVGAIVPSSYVSSAPRSLSALDLKPGDGRIFTDHFTLASTAAIRGSLYPNSALVFGVESAQAYSSLASARHSVYLHVLSPAMLNVMNVRYFMVPLEPRADTKALVPYSELALDIINNEEVIPPTDASSIEIHSFTERASDLAQGTQIAIVDVRRRDGRTESFPLRVGIETNDWDIERKNKSLGQVQVARTFPGFWRSFGRGFDGHAYTARFTFDSGEIVGVNVRVERRELGLTIERINLYNAPSQSQSLAQLAGKDDFAVAYLSDTTAAWENLNVLPRAFIAHAAVVVDDSAAYDQMRASGFAPDKLVVLSDGQPMQSSDKIAHDQVEIVEYKADLVRLNVSTDQPGYLVLADSWYPGWNATLDGQPTNIYRADVLFRAVKIEPGTHSLVFEYRPMSFMIGIAMSVVSIILLAFISFFYFRFRTV
jgi:hypothetical protein